MQVAMQQAQNFLDEGERRAQALEEQARLRLQQAQQRVSVCVRVCHPPPQRSPSLPCHHVNALVETYLNLTPCTWCHWRPYIRHISCARLLHRSMSWHVVVCVNVRGCHGTAYHWTPRTRWQCQCGSVRQWSRRGGGGLTRNSGPNPNPRGGGGATSQGCRGRPGHVGVAASAHRSARRGGCEGPHREVLKAHRRQPPCEHATTGATGEWCGAGVVCSAEGTGVWRVRPGSLPQQRWRPRGSSLMVTRSCRSCERSDAGMTGKAGVGHRGCHSSPR
jgi:hypothetical protein